MKYVIYVNYNDCELQSKSNSVVTCELQSKSNEAEIFITAWLILTGHESVDEITDFQLAMKLNDDQLIEALTKYFDECSNDALMNIEYILNVDENKLLYTRKSHEIKMNDYFIK